MDFHRAVAELDVLVETLEREGDERALLLLQLIDAIHRPALELISRGELDHPIARALLAMYDLAPVEDRVLVEEALDEIRPYIHSHGGQVDLLEVEDGVVHLRLAGACDGCAGSATTLNRGIEEALRARYPGFREIVAHPPERREPLLQIKRATRPVFVEACTVDDVSPGEMRVVDADGTPVLLVNVAGELYAFRNGCAVDGLPLEGGRLTGTTLVCPWHNCAFDARSGKRVDGSSEAGLTVVPIAVGDGAVRVAVNVA
jgi:nitrite reductase/ring-hydroxylating ferredoxin subunit/Fe-S cluster biogenesis protein NfuA